MRACVLTQKSEEAPASSASLLATPMVSIGLLTCTSHLTAITFSQVSPNPMAVPIPILLHLKRRPKRIFSQKLHLNQNIIF